MAKTTTTDALADTETQTTDPSLTGDGQTADASSTTDTGKTTGAPTADAGTPAADAPDTTAAPTTTKRTRRAAAPAVAPTGDAETLPIEEEPTFPREMQCVNATATPYVIGATLIPRGGKASIVVRDEAALKRMEADCEHLLALNGSYKDVDPPALRIEEIDADAE